MLALGSVLSCQYKAHHLVVYRGHVINTSGNEAYLARDLDVISTSGNESYLAMKRTERTSADPADYETPLSVHPSSQPPAGDSLYEPV